MKLITVVVIALGASVLLVATAAAEPLTRVRVSAADPVALALALEAEGFDVLEGFVTPTSVDVVVTAAERRLLSRRGLAPATVSVGRPYREIQDDGRAMMVPAGYLDWAAIVDSLTATAADHPSIAMIVDLTATYGVPPTFEGRPLHALKISDNVAVREDEPAFLVVSAHHCRELVTPVIALDAIERLTDGHGTDPRITALVDAHEIWVAPVWNPDGYVHVFDVDNLWRKNRRVFPGGVGVDLNRNYPTGWNTNCAGSTNVTSNTYKGPTPASEPEVATMMAWSEDLHFAKVLDYHSSGREVLWGYACPPHPWDAFVQAEAVELSTVSSYAGAERPPSADGEHYQWQLARIASHAFLTETQTQFQPPHADAQAEAADVWPGTLWFLERPIPTSGHVTHACTGEPLEASISYPGVPFVNGEVNQSFLPFGRYHAFPPPGSHVLEFSAPGFVTEQRTVTLGVNDDVVLDVQLTPTQVPVADAGPDLELTCLTTMVTLAGSSTGGPNHEYWWEPNADVSDPTVRTPTTSVPGTYTLTVTDLDTGCTHADLVDVTEAIVLPVAEAGPDRSVNCENPVALLEGSASGGMPGAQYAYSWEPAANVSDPTAPTPTTTVPGVYTLTVTSLTDGCVAQDQVVVDTPPVASPMAPSDLSADAAAQPLLVRWDAPSAPRLLDVTWEDVSAFAYELHRGSLPSDRSLSGHDHEAVACDLPGPSWRLTPRPGSGYFIAVGANCEDVVSSFGVTSLGSARLDALAASGRPCP